MSRMARVEKMLRSVYMQAPAELRPPLKRSYHWLRVRALAASSRRSVVKGERVVFLDYDIAHLEPEEILGPGRREVLVDVHRSLVSPGTETAILTGLPGTPRRFPFEPGYSGAGVVRAVGPGVETLRAGDRVAGGLHHARRDVIAAALLVKIPEWVSFEEASFVVLAVIAQQGVRKARIEVGERVAVVGAGLVGQLAARLARLAGAAWIVTVASSRRREAPATAEGGADVFLAGPEGEERCDAVEADVVIEAAGTPSALVAALRCAGRGGRVVVLGSARSLGRDLPWDELAQDRELSVVGAHISLLPEVDDSPGRWTFRHEAALFMELVRQGRLRVADLVSWRADPRSCNAVYERLLEREGSHLGVVFEWDDDGGGTWSR
jgi:2-desacetyl-2-hydroxyethyl bacteriochlorophyllide A dehydrogenase